MAPSENSTSSIHNELLDTNPLAPSPNHQKTPLRGILKRKSAYENVDENGNDDTPKPARDRKRTKVKFDPPQIFTFEPDLSSESDSSCDVLLAEAAGQLSTVDAKTDDDDWFDSADFLSILAQHHMPGDDTSPTLDDPSTPAKYDNHSPLPSHELLPYVDRIASSPSPSAPKQESPQSISQDLATSTNMEVTVHDQSHTNINIRPFRSFEAFHLASSQDQTSGQAIQQARFTPALDELILKHGKATAQWSAIAEAINTRRESEGIPPDTTAANVYSRWVILNADKQLSAATRQSESREAACQTLLDQSDDAILEQVFNELSNGFWAQVAQQVGIRTGKYGVSADECRTRFYGL